MMFLVFLTPDECQPLAVVSSEGSSILGLQMASHFSGFPSN